MNVAATLRQIMSMWHAYRTHAYPHFVYGAASLGRDIPAFYYHDVDTREFEGQLRYLRANGYEAVTCDEARALHNEPDTPTPPRHVMLTFDDGLASLYRDVFPLAKSYQQKIVAYIVPSWIGTSYHVTWKQCIEMHESGWVDIQSHSCQHFKGVAPPEVLGIWSRGSKTHPWNFAGVTSDHLTLDASCLPVFAGRSLFQDQETVDINDEFWLECAEVSKSETSRKSLIVHFRRLSEALATAARLGPQARYLRMVEDLDRSRAIIEKRLASHRVRHFAFPWHIHSQAAWNAMVDAGFASGAVGLKDDLSERVAPRGAAMIHRVSGDFLQCLPGDGRGTIRDVLARKAGRQLVGS